MPAVMMRMLLNVVIDTLLGFIPLVGDAFDAVHKANAKNAALVEQALVNPQATARGSWLRLFGALVVLILIVLGGFVGTVFLAKWLWNLTG